MVDKTGQIAFYEALLAKHGASFKALGWNSPESQKIRFQVFKEIFIYGKKAANVSVLDVGCGFGDFLGFLKGEGLLTKNKISYTGYDISPKLLEVAKKKYPEGKYELKDILEESRLPSFDYVFCSGIFNIRTSDTESHLEYVKAMLLRMSDLAAQGVAVNFLSEGALPVDSAALNAGRYFYFKPEQIVNFCRQAASRYIIRHDYHPGDFTVYLLK